MKMHPRGGSCECERTDGVKEGKEGAKENEMNAMYMLPSHLPPRLEAGRRKDINRRRGRRGERGDLFLLMMGFSRPTCSQKMKHLVESMPRNSKGGKFYPGKDGAFSRARAPE